MIDARSRVDTGFGRLEGLQSRSRAAGPSRQERVGGAGPVEWSMRSMKVRPSVKTMCEKCKVIRRHGRVMVICTTRVTSKGRARWPASPASTSRARSGSRSRSPTSTASASRRRSRSVTATGINLDTRVRDLTDEEVARLRTYIDANLKVEGDLRRDVAQDIKRKMEIGSYQGIRHRRASRSTASARTPTPAPARDRRRPSPERRRCASSMARHTTDRSPERR